MTRSHPSPLALALLRFIESDNEALAGDLAEEWRAGRSRRWFWHQLLRAVVVVSWRKRVAAPAAVCLFTTTPVDRPDRGLALIDPATINLSGIKVRGIGGLGLLSVIMLITVVIPQAWFLVVAGLAGGAVLGVVMVVRRRDRGLAGPDDSAPVTLFGSQHAGGGIPVDPRRSGVSRLVIVTR
jgi:hypothetical protein